MIASTIVMGSRTLLLMSGLLVVACRAPSRPETQTWIPLPAEATDAAHTPETPAPSVATAFAHLRDGTSVRIEIDGRVDADDLAKLGLAAAIERLDAVPLPVSLPAPDLSCDTDADCGILHVSLEGEQQCCWNPCGYAPHHAGNVEWIAAVEAACKPDAHLRPHCGGAFACPGLILRSVCRSSTCVLETQG